MKKLSLLFIALCLSHQAAANINQRELARQLAQQSDRLLPQLASKNYQAPLDGLLHRSRMARSISPLNMLALQADRQAQQSIGLNDDSNSLMELRLATPKQRAALEAGEKPLVAYIPDGDEHQWDSIEAFDNHGNSVLLNVDKAPQRPVLVVAPDAKKAKQAGLSVLIQALKQAGIATAAKKNQLSATQLTSINLKQDEEPWILGDAEIYAIVAGINPSRKEPVVDIIDMPYLDQENMTYKPNQILFYWDRYRWGAADLVLMEHDSNTNYKALAKLLVDALKLTLSVAGYPQAAPFMEIGNQALNAIPDDWMTNSDDYVDSFYSLERDQHYQDYPGARNNAVISLTPKQYQDTQP